MEEKELHNTEDDTLEELPMVYIEDNNLKIFLDDTVDLGEVVSEVEDTLIKEDTNETHLDE